MAVSIERALLVRSEKPGEDIELDENADDAETRKGHTSLAIFYSPRAKPLLRSDTTLVAHYLMSHKGKGDLKA